jgi:hypothetical protein
MRDRRERQPGDDEPKEDPPKKGLLKKLAEHPLAKPLLVAGALHLPLQKDVGNALERAAHATAEAMRHPWEREHMVLDPQSKEQKDAVTRRVADREGRVDVAARAAYKAETEKKLEAGEGPSFKRMQFDLEKLNGVPAGETTTAEQKADALVEKYAAEVGDDLDEEELRRISTEMYGPDATYDWGQASVTRYFNNGDRNCVAVSRAQSIVLEGVLARLPPEKRARWRQVTQIVKQHEISGIEHLGDDGQRDTLLLLEGKNTRKWRGVEPEPGTATLPMGVVKKALVSAKPVEVKAAGRPGEVKESPRIDAVTDEPAELNVKIEGKLKGAESNEREAKREGIEPRKMTEAELAAQAEQEKGLEGQVMQVELLTDLDPDGARARVRNAPAIETVNPWNGLKEQGIKKVDARDLDAPSKDVVVALGEVDDSTGHTAWRVSYGTMERWQPEAVRQALRNGNGSISVETKPGGRLAENFLKEYAAIGKEGGFGPTNIKIEYGGKDQKVEGGDIHPEDLRILLAGDGQRLVDVSGMYIDDFDALAAVIRDMPADKTVVMPKGMNYNFGGRDAFKQFGTTRGKVMMPYDAYGELLGKHPDILDSKHFLFDTTATNGQLESLQKIIEGIRPNHPLLVSIDMLKKAHAGMKTVGDEQGHVDPTDLWTPIGDADCAK